MKSRRRQSNSRKGAAMVEMALVLPIFLMLIFGIIEFGRGMMVSNLVTNAAREATRQAVLDGSNNADVTNGAKTFLVSALGGGLTSSDVTVNITITPAAGNPSPVANVSAAKSRDLISISVQIPFNKVALIPGTYLKNKNLIGRSSMRHE